MRDGGTVNPNAVKSVTQNPRMCVKRGKIRKNLVQSGSLDTQEIKIVRFRICSNTFWNMSYEYEHVQIGKDFC